jgi:hypothetical protein
MAFKTRKVISEIQSLIFGLVESMNEADPDESAKPGSGNRTKTKREPGDFDSIEIISTTKVKVRVNVVVGDQSELEIEIDDNLQAVLAADVTNRRLTVKNLEKYRSKEGLVVNVKTKGLNSIAMQGDVIMTVRNFKNDALSVNTAGLSELMIDGKVSVSKIELNGSGADVNLSRLLAREVDLKINGSGNVALNVTDRLKVIINGTGNVRYKGNPADVKKEIRGLGMVIPEEN